MRLAKNMAPVKKPMAFALESRHPMEYRYQDNAAFSNMLIGTKSATWFLTTAISNHAAR